MSRSHLILLRHAKSDWDDPALDDHARPLAARGRQASAAIARWFAATDLRIEQVFCSDSRRTRETAELALAALPSPPPVDWCPELYLASAAAMLALIQAQGGSHRTLMLIGHEPGIGQLANSLAQQNQEPERLRMAAKFPTAALAVIGFRTRDWRNIQAGEGRLVSFVRPKDLAGS